MKKKLLVIEDESSVAKQLKWCFSDLYEITFAYDAEAAKPLLASGLFPVATLDLGLPPSPDTPNQGLKLLKSLPAIAPSTRVIVITGNDDEENALKAIALGATDFCSKPFDIEILKIILERTFKLQSLEESNRKAIMANVQKGKLCGMIGISSAMEDVFERIKHASMTDYPLLITGKTGTGKEMAVNAVHALSKRAKNRLIIINCGAIPENLVESELFGHEKGSFTGATERKTGKFEQADNGTLFLDEISELPAQMQVKILRFLQESTIERVGGNKTIHLNVRIIAATNIELAGLVKAGKFREDLFYRLNVVPLTIPELNERKEDILFLAHHFLSEESRELGRGQVSFSPEALTAMTAHNWPGNVRELQNRIKRAMGTTIDKMVSPVHLGLNGKNEPDQKNIPLMTLKKAREKAEVNTIRQALSITANNISKAAKLLATSRPTLHDLLKKHGIKIEK